ncbi:hypothetical protein ABPG72_009742 [Tetrahymena utriculariae]
MKDKKVHFVIQYYVERSFKLFVYPDRPRSFSIILLLIKEFLFIIRIFSSFLAQVNQISIGQMSSPTSSQKNEAYLIFNAQSRQILGVYTFFMSLIANILIVGFIIKDLILFFLNKPYKESFYAQIILKSYNYSLYPISVLISCFLLSSKYQYLALVNLIISFFLSLFVELLDYDYCFYINDFLSKKFNKLSLVTQALECLQICLLSQESMSIYTIGIVVSFLNQGIQLILTQYLNLYLSQTSKIIITQFSLLNISLLSFSIFYTHYSRLAPNIFLLFIFFTLPIKAGNILSNFIDNYIVSSISSDIESQSILWKEYSQLPKIERFLRIINQQNSVFIYDYVKSNLSQTIENALANHIINCHIGEDCFCKKMNFDYSQEDKISFITNEKNTDSVKRLSYSILKAHTQELPTGLSDFQISYFKFIEDVMENQTLSITSLIKVQQNCFEKFNLFEIQVINKMADKVRNQIQQNNINKQSYSESQIVSNKQKKISLIQHILFDEKISLSFNQMLNCFYQKRKLLHTLNQDVINLDDFEKLSYQLLQERSQLKTALKQLILQNSSQSQLQKICKLYDLVLDIDDYFEGKISSQRQFNCLTSIPLYSKDTCTAYISFTTKLGVVTKVSTNFDKVVPVLPNREVIGKNIGFMQPDVVAPLHNTILRNFIQKKIVSQKVSDYPLLIGKDKKGFAIPYEMKLQVAMIGLEDFGCAGWIKQVKDQTHYIMTSTDSTFKNFIMSYSFYDLILSQCFRQSELTSVKFGNVIPLYQTLFENNMSGQLFQTILIKPQYKEQIENPIKFQKNPGLFQQLMNLELYLIQAKILHIKTALAEFNYLLIFSCEYIDNLFSKRDALKEFRKDLKNYTQTEDFDDVEFENLFSDDYYNQSCKSSYQSEDYQNFVKLSYFKNKQNVSYASRLQKIIKQNRLKIRQMYKSFNLFSGLSYQNSTFSKNLSLFDENQITKIDEIQENDMSNLSAFNQMNTQRQSCNVLVTKRAEIYFEENKQISSNNIMNSSNSKLTNWNNFFYGIEQLMFDNGKTEQRIENDKKLKSLKSVNYRRQLYIAKELEIKEQVKSNLVDTKVILDKDTSMSADISFLLNLKKNENKVAEGSVNQSVGKTKSQKRQMVSQIYSNSKQPMSFYSGYLLDFILIALLVISISISLSSNINFISQYQTKEKLFSNLTNIKNMMFNIIEQIYLIDGIQKNYFKLANEQEKQSFLQMLQWIKDDNIQRYKNSLQTIFKDYLNEQRINELYQLELDYQTLSYVEDKFVSQKIPNSTLLSVLIKTQFLFTLFENKSISSVDFLYQNELRYNQNNTQSQVSFILDQLSQDQSSANDSLKKISLIFIVVYCVFIFLYNILLFFFYFNMFSLKQSLLSIFATIDIKKLEDMTNRTNTFIKYILNIKKKNKILDLTTSKKDFNLNYQIKEDHKKNCKKKNISLTTYEKKLTIYKTVLIIFCTALILIKPIIDYFLIQIETNSMNVEGLLKNNSERMMSAFSDFNEAKFIYTYYLQGTTEVSYNYTTQNQEKYLLQSFSNIQSAMTDFMNAYQSYSNSNLIQQQQQNITYIISFNICDPLKQYSSNLIQFNVTDITECLKIYQSTDNSGFYISSQKFQTVQFGILEYFNSNIPQSQKQGYLDSYFQENSVSDQFYQLRILQQTSQLLIQVINTQQQSFFNAINIINIILAIFQVLLIVNISYFVQKYIFKKISLEYFQSMKFLTLIDYDILMENPYFISHLRKSK